MARAVRFTDLFINTKIARCAHSCRYCSISKKDFSDLPFSRFEDVVDSLIEWVSKNRGSEFGIYPVANNCDDIDDTLIPPYMRLLRRAGRTVDLMTTGGLRMRAKPQMKGWLSAWHEHGVNCVHASYAGHGPTHDRWNGRRGDFVWLLAVQQLAMELGMELGQSLFLAKSTLPLLNALIEELDAIGAKVRYRRIFPFAYVGLAARHEDDRIDEAIRDALPDLLGAAAPDTSTWHSEREWIDLIYCDPEDSVLSPVTFHLEVSDANIDQLESTPWDDIMADLETRTRAVYAAIPPIGELCSVYGDAANARIYASRIEMDRMWLARHLAATGTPLDLTLTQLGVDQ